MARLCVAKLFYGWIIMTNSVFIEVNVYMVMMNEKIRRTALNANSNASMAANFDTTILQFVISTCFGFAGNCILLL